MSLPKNFQDPKIEELLVGLRDTPARDPRAVKKGRAQFLAQARRLSPAVSNPTKLRHTGWNKNIFERIWKNMKPKFKWTVGLAVVMLAVMAVFLVNNITTVSAQQVLQRATTAASADKTAVGIQHTVIESYNNPTASAQGGVKTVSESYHDLATGAMRSVTRDAAGKIVEASAFDGTMNYYSSQPAGAAGSLTIQRVPQGQDGLIKRAISGDSTYDAKALFDSFSANPRVVMVGKQTWTNGSQVYVLADHGYQAQKSGDVQTPTGTMQMVFDSQTYKLVASQMSIVKDGQDVVIQSYNFLVDEVLPEGSPVTWNLSDLPGVTFVDAPAQPAQPPQAGPGFGTISAQELAAHTPSYQLKTLPAGFTQEIVAPSTQEAGQDHYQFEIHYKNAAGQTFELMAVGQMDAGFVEASFYDGSYKTASGLVLHFSPSSTEKSTSAMLVTPDGSSYLVGGIMPREQVQTLAEDLVLVP
jgi:hypothetical protein